MNGEAGVLQDRIEIASLERRLEDAQERVRRDQDEQQECDGNPGLHGQHIGLEPGRQVSAEQRDQRTEQARE